MSKQGVIEFIALEDRELITAGDDGYIKRWKFDRLEFAEASDDDPVIQLEPISETKVGDGVKVHASNCKSFIYYIIFAHPMNK
jgi:hypothetical protein